MARVRSGWGLTGAISFRVFQAAECRGAETRAPGVRERGDRIKYAGLHVMAMAIQPAKRIGGAPPSRKIDPALYHAMARAEKRAMNRNEIADAIAKLRSEEAGERIKGAQTLANYRSPEGREPLIEAVEKEKVREVLIELLKAVQQCFDEWYYSKDEESFSQKAVEMAERANETVKQIFLRSLNYNDNEVTKAALWAIVRTSTRKKAYEIEGFLIKTYKRVELTNLALAREVSTALTDLQAGAFY